MYRFFVRRQRIQPNQNSCFIQSVLAKIMYVVHTYICSILARSLAKYVQVHTYVQYIFTIRMYNNNKFM